MSVALKKGINAKAKSRKCAARFWRLFPHLSLCLSLVAYAALGALMFRHIEGGSSSATPQEYHEFLGQIVITVQNLTGEWPQIFVPSDITAFPTFRTSFCRHLWTFYGC